MKIGIDLHGVLDTNPELFTDMACEVLNSIIATKPEVHIVTGMPWSKELREELVVYGNGVKWWTHFYSITDDLLKRNIKWEVDENGNKSFPDYSWNIAKAIYCSHHNIDIMYDDSPTYGRYFITPYVQYQHTSEEERKTFDKKKLFVDHQRDG